MPDDATKPQPAADETLDNSGESVLISSVELETLKQEAGEWRERCQRSQAEFDNVRKRLRKEADEAGTRAIARFVKPILNELDNLERAIAAASPNTFNEFAQGVTMIRENLHSALLAAGLEAVPVEGAFDPMVHEVIAESEHADVPKGTIVQVFRSGWRLKDQLVRSAQVVVAKPPANAG